MKRIGGLLPIRAVKRYLDTGGPNWATIIAWNLFFAFFPMVILAITVVGLVLQDPGTRATIEHQVVAAFPSCSAQAGCQILDALNSFQQRTGLYALIGVIGLVWTGMSLFSAIEQGLDALHGIPTRGFFRQKLMCIVMVVLFTVLAVPLVATGSLLSLLQSLPGLPDFLRSGPASLIIQVAGGVIVATILFGVILYVVPNRKQSVRSVLPGAVTIGVLFEALTLLFPLYFRLVTHSPQWGQTFGFVFVLLFYFFLVGQLVMLGGALNAVVQPAPEAKEPVTKLSQSGNITAPAS